MGFQANKDNFDESSYVKVNERLQEFWTKYPEGYISTFRSEAKNGIIFKTVLCRNEMDARLFSESGVASSTGHAYLPDSMKGEKVEEYCETVSLGRALAILGFKVEKSIASGEEMAQFARQKEAKQDESKDVDFFVGKEVAETKSGCSCVTHPEDKCPESCVIAASNITTSVAAGDPTNISHTEHANNSDAGSPGTEPKMKLANNFKPRSRFKRS